jgi:hypothetical protein
MVVTGVNKFSYIFRLGLKYQSDADDVVREIHLMEATYDNGNWGLKKIADINGTPTIFTESQKFSTANTYVFRIQSNPLGNELQAVKTADGQNILVKWVDLTIHIPINPPQTISYYRNGDPADEQQTTIDSTYTDDLFVSYRAINSTNWTVPKNITNDSAFDKVTWIPDIIPSITNVPFISHMSPYYNSGPLMSVPRALFQQVSDLWPFIRFATFDATSTVAVEEQNTSTSSDILYDIYPNPVSGYSEISFNLANDCYARIELSNSLGQRVSTLLDGFQSAGIHAINVNVDKYFSGIYYYTLTTDKGAVTKILNVVK